MYSHLKLTYFMKKSAELLLVGHLLQRLAEQACLHEGKGKIDIIEWKRQNILL